jgi:DNA polymerase III epsilon subunit-like protein
MQQKEKVMRLIFLDTETTGLYPNQGHEIIEIAMITRFADGREEIFETKIKPQRINQASAKALEVNGYNEVDWRDAMKMEDAIIEIAKRLPEGMIVGYNPYFDWKFIQAALREYDLEPSYRVRCLDCMVLAFEHLKPLGLRGMSLDAVRAFLDWDKDKSHTALKDTMDVKRLFDMYIK